MRAPDIRHSAGRHDEQEYVEQVAWASQARKQREAEARACGLRPDWAREFSNSELDEYIAIAELVQDARKPFNLFHAGIVLSVIVIVVLPLSLQGCGGGDPEPDPTIGMERDVHNPHPCIKPVLPPECEDHAPEGTQHSQQWHDQCDGPNT